MENTTPAPKNFFKTACYFEISLIFVAAILGKIVDVNPFAHLYFSEIALLYGILGTLPLLLFFFVTQNINVSVLQEIRELLITTLCPSLSRHHWADLALLALIAGISEEILFRGALQPWLENLWGIKAGLIISSLIFGLIHAVTPLYAILASLVSLYLGLSLDYGGTKNLLIPITIHSLYDFVVFLILIDIYKKR